jgi:hypothetical protein
MKTNGAVDKLTKQEPQRLIDTEVPRALKDPNLTR